MRSGSGVRHAPPGSSPPAPPMRSTGVPAPSICAPAALRKAAASAISGSQAAPRRMLCPCAQAAAIISVSVAPTLGRRSV